MTSLERLGNAIHLCFFANEFVSFQQNARMPVDIKAVECMNWRDRYEKNVIDWQGGGVWD